MVTEEQLYRAIDEAITDPLERQNTAAVVRELLKYLVKNLAANNNSNQDIDLTKISGWGPDKQLITDAEGNMKWVNKGLYD